MYDDVGLVSADLVVRGKGKSPDIITRALGIAYDYAHSMGDPIMSARGIAVDTRKYNYWSYTSTALTTSKNLDDHLRALLALFTPLSDVIHELNVENEVFIVCHWESNRLVGGSGPLLAPETCADIGLLGVELHFDLYCSLEHSDNT